MHTHTPTHTYTHTHLSNAVKHENRVTGLLSSRHQVSFWRVFSVTAIPNATSFWILCTTHERERRRQTFSIWIEIYAEVFRAQPKTKKKRIERKKNPYCCEFETNIVSRLGELNVNNRSVHDRLRTELFVRRLTYSYQHTNMEWSLFWPMLKSYEDFIIFFFALSNVAKINNQTFCERPMDLGIALISIPSVYSRFDKFEYKNTFACLSPFSFFCETNLEFFFFSLVTFIFFFFYEYSKLSKIADTIYWKMGKNLSTKKMRREKRTNS